MDIPYEIWVQSIPTGVWENKNLQLKFEFN